MSAHQDGQRLTLHTQHKRRCTHNIDTDAHTNIHTHHNTHTNTNTPHTHTHTHTVRNTNIPAETQSRSCPLTRCRQRNQQGPLGAESGEWLQHQKRLVHRVVRVGALLATVLHCQLTYEAGEEFLLHTQCLIRGAQCDYHCLPPLKSIKHLGSRRGKG